MPQKILVESFVTAIACLCASSFDPNYSKMNFKSNHLSEWDRNVLSVLYNSNHVFSFGNDSLGCVLPDENQFADRIMDLEYQINNQKKQSDKLKEDFKLLREKKIKERKIVYVNSHEEELKNLKSEVDKLGQILKDLNSKCNEKDTEITELRKKQSEDKREIEKLRAENILLQAEVKEAKAIPIIDSCLGKEQGVKPIKIIHQEPLVCDQRVDLEYGEGWMLVAQRFDGRKHFFRNWANYSKGFEKRDIKREFFVGLDLISDMTQSAPHELLIILVDTSNKEVYAKYDHFLIGSQGEYYCLKKLGNFNGTAGDSLTYHLGQKFTTFDQDNDANVSENCAGKHTGAWWYKDCHKSNLFGLYRTRRSSSDRHYLNGMIWSSFHNTDDGGLKSMRMYLRLKKEIK